MARKAKIARERRVERIIEKYSAKRVSNCMKKFVKANKKFSVLKKGIEYMTSKNIEFKSKINEKNMG